MKRPRMPKSLSVLNGDDLVTTKVQSVGDTYERIEVLGTRIIDGSINVPMTNSEGPDNNIAMAVELDHMYLSCSDSKASLSKDIEIQQLKELLFVHLDLIHQQAEELVAKDKKIKSLKDENENLRLRLERMDRRVSLTTSKKTPTDVPSSPSVEVKEDVELSPTPALKSQTNCVSPKACKIEDADSPVTRNHKVTETPKKTPPKTTTPPALKVTSPSARERRPRNKDAGKDASHSENESDHDVATVTSTAVTTTTTTTTTAASTKTTAVSPRTTAASPRSAAVSPRSAAGSPRSTAASPRTTPTPSSPARATTEDKLLPKKEEERTRNRSGQKRRHQVQQETLATSEETDTSSTTTPNKRTRDRRERLSPGDTQSTTNKTPSTDQHNLRPRERTKDDAGTPKREGSSDLRPSTPTIRTAALETKRLRQRLLLKDQAGRRRETRGQPQDSKIVRGEGVLTTTLPYFLPTPNIPCEELSGGEEPTQNVVEIPRWRKRLLTSLYVMEGTENLDDEIFNKRHAKHEQDEKRRKRWDLQRLREQRRYERLRERYEGRQGGGDSQEPCDLSLWPMPDSARYLHVDDSVPVCAFGHALATYTPSEFWLPWLADGNSTNPGMSTRRRKR
ncbi:uncharacterized protein LOC143031819 [Oratosquilla oratoria]|uniref:uncharacterized protein LOC143031819 n=1 Tax=Oratosquilla oratoria TaxID=337810 RepID=UPI003F75A69A